MQPGHRVGSSDCTNVQSGSVCLVAFRTVASLKRDDFAVKKWLDRMGPPGEFMNLMMDIDGY